MAGGPPDLQSVYPFRLPGSLSALQLYARIVCLDYILLPPHSNTQRTRFSRQQVWQKSIAHRAAGEPGTSIAFQNSAGTSSKPLARLLFNAFPASNIS